MIPEPPEEANSTFLQHGMKKNFDEYSTGIFRVQEGLRNGFEFQLSDALEQN